MWQYQYGDGDTGTSSTWFTGGDTENIANNIDEKINNRNWNTNHLDTATPTTQTINQQQINNLAQNYNPETNPCDGLAGPACVDTNECEWVDDHFCELDDEDATEPGGGWALTQHEPEGKFDESQAWTTARQEEWQDYDDSVEASEVDTILCRFSRWLPIEAQGC